LPRRTVAATTFPQCGKLISTAWNFRAPFFHGVEKSLQSCSIAWKIWRKFFHCVEQKRLVFPRCGTFDADFSTVWKTREKVAATIQLDAAVAVFVDAMGFRSCIMVMWINHKKGTRRHETKPT